MDFTILYRVLWKPGEVFKEFLNKTRPEPFIFVAIIVPLSLLLTHRNDLQQFFNQPVLVATSLLKGLYSSLKWPFTNGIIVYLYVRSIAKYKVQILPLISAFTLCLLPRYISRWIEAVSGHPGYLFGAGALFPALKETQPILFSFIAVINLFFLWVIILWHSALNQLLNISKQQMTILLVILVLLPIVLSWIWFASAVMIFNLFNPAS